MCDCMQIAGEILPIEKGKDNSKTGGTKTTTKKRKKSSAKKHDQRENIEVMTNKHKQ